MLIFRPFFSTDAFKLPLHFKGKTRFPNVVAYWHVSNLWTPFSSTRSIETMLRLSICSLSNGKFYVTSRRHIYNFSYSTVQTQKLKLVWRQFPWGFYFLKKRLDPPKILYNDTRFDKPFKSWSKICNFDDLGDKHWTFLQKKKYINLLTILLFPFSYVTCSPWFYLSSSLLIYLECTLTASNIKHSRQESAGLIFRKN